MLASRELALLAAGATLAGAQLTLTPGAPTDQYNPDLIGTWSSKSNKTFTGPGFYNPKTEKLIEPSHTGISYSFTGDGSYEVAYYRSIANPVNPACPKGVMQWQHGHYLHLTNGSLATEPFGVDGRQLMSDPCNSDHGLYTHYRQPEMFNRYEVLTDPYHNIPRLNLYRFDGSPIMPLYLAFSPPMMLPTSTLHPTDASPQQTAASPTSSKFRLRRSLDDFHTVWSRWKLSEGPREWQTAHYSSRAVLWFGIGSIGVGSVMYFCF